jgi:glycosyltransferase involved in cell wall biosynthesis
MSLKKIGHEVTVVAQSDNPFESVTEGIRVIGVKRASRKVFHPLTILRVLMSGWKCDCDVYHCHEPGSLFAGIILKIFKGSKLVYDAHEYYPHLISTNSVFPVLIQSLVEQLADFEERLFCRFPDSVITVNDVLAKQYSKINADVHVIPNYPDLQPISHKVRNFDMPLIAYVGTVTKERGVFEVIQAYEDVVKQVPEAGLLIMGGFISKKFESFMRNYVENKGLTGVEITGHLPYDVAMSRLADVTIGMAVLQPIDRYLKAVPVKLFEYMMNGIPVIASDFPFIREIVDSSECGILVDPVEVEQISVAMMKLVADSELSFKMSNNGRKAVESMYNWSEMERKLISIYMSLENSQ